MTSKPVSTKDLYNLRVVWAKNGKRIGKVRHFVFHPTEKRCIGMLVKRPDAALMFHRKDLFVALDGFSIDDEGRIAVSDDDRATDRGAIKALGVNWGKCVLWVGMPVMTASGDVLGYVSTVAFDGSTGVVRNMTTENGAANDAILGTRTIPAKYVRGFRRGQGVALVSTGDYQGEDVGDEVEKGAIVVADEAVDLPIEGGVAAAAGKVTAIAADKAKQGAAKAKESAMKVKKVADGKIDEARPGAQKFAEKAGEAIDSGTFAVGKQIGKASGMFSAFKEEFDKASHGEGKGE